MQDALGEIQCVLCRIGKCSCLVQVQSNYRKYARHLNIEGLQYELSDNLFKLSDNSVFLCYYISTFFLSNLVKFSVICG